MKIKKLTLEEIDFIYNKFAKNDFAEDELKPISVINNLIRDNKYIGYGLYENYKLISYAFFYVSFDSKICLLDYFAVCNGFRGLGYGSEYMKLIKNEMVGFKGLIVEVENPEFALNPQEKEIRERRIEFYKRNGFIVSELTCRMFDIEFIIIYLPLKNNLNSSEIHYELNNIYINMFSDKIYRKKVVLRNKNEESF